ncbi:MAG: ABC transporter ATP-binding protein [Syntrophorhabdaceae bacterium]|jgi:oligopeptide/dipeptide ABC transporter ATP-binding protein|nr:ABC transporter ATP-binding protein [Syntrophorhabdaceae bacterium]MDD5243621.1 ABC transporter ATP-binding protein [Syntrophorhabdaceae bacterium]
MQLLDVTDLNTSFFTDKDVINAVDGVSFSVSRGEIFGLIGESGCGKTMTAMSVMRLVQPPGRIVKGKVVFEGRDLLGLSEREMEGVRGGRIGMIFQEPMSALNPVFRVGEQISEAIIIHKNVGKREAKGRAIELLKQVGFDEPEKRYAQYPHQLSGGQRQRILIGIAISCGPSLVIADEPTTALDVATESQIINLLQDLVNDFAMSMIFITHNLNIMRKFGKRIGIMYAGRMLEQNLVDIFFREPLHPYSKGLLSSIYGLTGNEKRLTAIPGSVPKLAELPRGCKFHPRCPYVMPVCREGEPIMKQIGNGQWVRCYLY